MQSTSYAQPSAVTTTRSKPKAPPGIEINHATSCRSRIGRACSCAPSCRAWVYDKRTGRKIRKNFRGRGALAAAKQWRADATGQVRRGELAAPSSRTFADAAEQWLAGAEAEPPTVLNRNGQPYKPSVLRGYRADLENHLLPDLGGHRLGDIRRGDLQALVDRLAGRGLSGSKIRNVIIAARVVFRHALERDELAVNPTANLRLPNGSKPRERAATATEAASLLAALPELDRALWATAFYGGLRRGELRALKWSDADLANGVIRVARAWDDVAGEIAPKSEKGTRNVPITAVLRDFLTDLKARTGRDGDDFVFGPHRDRPFTPSYIRKRAAAAWATENAKRTKKHRESGAKGKPILLTPIGLHECRHTFVSLMHDAGLSLERIGDYVGHSSAYMTDRYRHLLEGHEAEATRLLDAYLARADTSARLDQIGGAAD